MGSTKAKSSYIYIIDNEDRIVAVSDNWLSFAQENDAFESCCREIIINQPIWNFISGNEAIQLYQIIFKNIRRKNKSVKLPYRCDSPEKRRYLELIITPLELGGIKLSNQVIREEPRNSINILDISVSRSHEFIKMCSLCKKVEMPGACWIDVEDAVVLLKLFEKQELPQISHGICTNCLKLCMIEIEKIY